MTVRSNVTAIIPCFNDGAYIMQALQSLYNQTLLPEQIIIVDDGSNEETRLVLKQIKHSFVHIVYQDNKGVSHARNTGIALAQTDYILNLDADDYYEPTFIEKATGILDTDDNVVAVSSYCRSFNASATLEIIKPLGGTVKNFIIINNGRASAMFRKSSWAAIGGFDETMLGGYEDWEFWIAVLKEGGKVHVIKEVLSHYRVKQVSRDKNALMHHDLELRQYIFSKHKALYEAHFDFYINELLRQNSLLRHSLFKIKNTKAYRLGNMFIAPIRYIKNNVFKA